MLGSIDEYNSLYSNLFKNGLFPHKLLHVSFTSKKFSSGLHLLIVSRIPILDQKAFLFSRNQLEHVREYQLIHSF